MKEPKEPLRSGKYILCPKFKETDLVYKLYIFPDCFEQCTIDEKLADEAEEAKLHGKEYIKPIIDKWWYDTDFVSLQDILDIVPKNTDPKNVVISIHRDRQVIDLGCRVVLRTKIDKEAWQKGHDEEEKEYNKQLKIYKEEKKKYYVWKTEQKMNVLKTKLSKLKSK